MVDFGTPYAVDGSVIPGAGLRRQLQRDAGAGSGVCRPGDLKVSALDVPGAGVKIAAGDDIIQCRAPGRDRESYGTPLFTAQDYLGDNGTGIPGTGSSGGRRDMIIHEIVDSSLPRTYTPRAQIPEGVYSKITVVPGVPAGAKRVQDVPALNEVTAVELAAINWPASRSTIEETYVEDLRRLHRPRQQEDIVHVLVQETANRDLTSASFVPWPAAAKAQVEIPDWATHAFVDAEIIGYVAASVPVSGYLRMRLDDDGSTFSDGPQIYYNEQYASSGGETWPVGGKQAVPVALRGKTGYFRMRGLRNAGSGFLRAPTGGLIKLRVTWVESL